VGRARAGDNLRLELIRDGRRQTVVVRSGTRPSRADLEAGRVGPDETDEEAAPSQAGVAVAGITVAPLTAALRQRYEVPAGVNGVVVTQPGRGNAQGFQPGYVILRAGAVPVTTVAAFQAAVQAARTAGQDSLFLLVWTPAGNRPLAYELPKSE
jgi:serine protease Do